MDHKGGNSSSTDDDNPGVPVGGHLAGHSRSILSSAPHQLMQSDMDFEIHDLERAAYSAVLRAFMAQSDALTWEKEGLISELRKVLRVSDAEHRELLHGVNSDDHSRRIRQWREGTGQQDVAINAPQHVNNQVAGPTVSASKAKQKISVSGNPSGTLSLSSRHPQSLYSALKRGPTSGIGARRTKPGQPALTIGKHMQYQLTDHVSPDDSTDDTSESIRDPLIGRKVMRRWPADNKFYEADITEYNPVNGRHALVYNRNMPNATVEWVDIKEVPHEDIRWVGDDPIKTQLTETGTSSRRGRPRSKNRFANEIQPKGKGVAQDSGKIEIFHTGSLLKKVEKVLNASNPNEFEVDRAHKLLKEQEEKLIHAIAKLRGSLDSDSEHPPEHGHSVGGQRNADCDDPSKKAGSSGSGRR